LVGVFTQSGALTGQKVVLADASVINNLSLA
jgi:hypothetical protein